MTDGKLDFAGTSGPRVRLFIGDKSFDEYLDEKLRHSGRPPRWVFRTSRRLHKMTCRECRAKA